MKQLLKIVIVLSYFISANGFSQIPEKWMKWTKTNCYAQIEYRARYVRTVGVRHQWEVQFRSKYDDLVVFNYGIEENPEALALTTHRKTLRGGETSEPISVYTENENFLLFTDKLSFYTDGSDPIPCDN